MRSFRLGALVIAAAFLVLAAAAKSRKDRVVVHGRVALADGSLPQLLVIVDRVCNGTPEMAGYADSEGRFSMEFASDEEANRCAARARLPGYRSTTLRAADANEGGGLGTLVLRWRGTKDDAAARSARSKQLTKAARKEYDTGLDEAAKGKVHDAEDSFEQAAKLFPWGSTPYLARGILYERAGNALEAKKAYNTAMYAEDGFILPFVYAVALDISRQEWQAALEHSKKILAVDAKAFPVAWFANAQAALNLHNVATAEASARQGIAMDTDHEYPELEYVLALALDDKGDHAGAVEHLKSYLALQTKGPSADAARQRLAALEPQK